MGFTCISIETANRMMGERDVTVVDIRDPQSFAAGRVPGAVSLNNANVDAFLHVTDVSKPVLVFCYHGHSSQGAADFLAGQGFDEVYSVDGGFEAWRLTYPCES